MATIVPGSMAGSNFTLARTITAADSDYAHAVIGNAIDCTGLKTIIIVAKLTTGSGTLSVQPCLHAVTARDATGAVTASVLAKGTPEGLADGGTTTLQVNGRMWTLHVPSISAGTEWALYVGVGEPFHADAQRKG